MVFIPLQFAYRIQFKGIFLALEILTILAYLLEIGIRVTQLKTSCKIQPLTTKHNRFDNLTIKDDIDKLKQRIWTHKFEIVVSLIAVVPFSLIFSYSQWYEPFGLYVFLCSLRLVKFRPIKKFWRWA